MSPLPRRFQVAYHEWQIFALEVTATTAEEAEALAEAQYQADGYESFTFIRGETDVEVIGLPDARAAA